MTDLVCKLSSRGTIPLEEMEKEKTKESKKKAILLAGPTGSGKTQLSFILSKLLGNCEIISADSMQVYRGMDIGTAKATLEERSHVPHHLIDIRNIDDPFNVVDFYLECHECLRSIIARGKTPLIVGGAGFYFRSLLYGPPSGPPSVPLVRKELEEELEKKGIDALFAKLEKFDPEYSATLTRGDKHKIIRALEIITLTDKPVSNFSAKLSSFEPDYDYRCWFVYRSRENLYKRIEKRCERMLEEGLLDEVRRLEVQGLLKNPSACQAIGYKQCLDYFKTDQSEEAYKNFVIQFKQSSRHYAKKQFTWFRREPTFRWLNIELHDFETAADIIIQDYKL